MTGKITGEIEGAPVDEAEHFIRCARCGGLMDCRDLDQIMAHEGPQPCPVLDRPQ